MPKETHKVEVTLDGEIMEQFIQKIEESINEVVVTSGKQDCQMELFTTLLSFASQVAQDVGIEKKSYLKLAGQFYTEAEEDCLNDSHVCSHHSAPTKIDPTDIN